MNLASLGTYTQYKENADNPGPCIRNDDNHNLNEAN